MIDIISFHLFEYEKQGHILGNTITNIINHHAKQFGKWS